MLLEGTNFAVIAISRQPHLRKYPWYRICVKRKVTRMADSQRMHNEWLKELLDRRGKGAGAELARFLGISEHAVSRARNGKREITSYELVLMGQFFNVEPPGLIRNTHLRAANLLFAMPKRSESASLEAFHNSLENLGQVERDFVLEYSLALADNLSDWQLVRRRR